MRVGINIKKDIPVDKIISAVNVFLWPTRWHFVWNSKPQTFVLRDCKETRYFVYE